MENKMIGQDEKIMQEMKERREKEKKLINEY